MIYDWKTNRGGFSHDFIYSYSDHIKRTEPSAKELSRQAAQQKELNYRPLISILTPVYNPNPQVLSETIQAVINQTYYNWELCLANASDQQSVTELIDQMAERDARIQPIHLTHNLGIAGNTNQALGIAHGEYIALMDHDDLISPNLLYEVVKVLNEHPGTDLVYYDEDKVTADGKIRLDPWYKPQAFSPDLLFSNNYLMHSVVRKSLVDEIGGFDSEVDGAQDWDLSIKITERSLNFRHIPQVLYHWRQVEGSAARDANAKPWAFAAQKKCIENYLTRHGYAGIPVSFEGLGVIRIHWPTNQKKASIIIPTRNNLSFLRACITSIIEKTQYSPYEILIVDNNSSDPEVFDYYSELSDYPQIKKLDYPYPFNFHSINNYAAQHATGEVLVFLNNDTEVLAPDWLEELIGQAVRPEVGIVGTKLLRPNGKIQHAGMIVGLQGHASHIFEDCPDHFYSPFGSTDWYRNYQSVTGACMAIRKQIFESVSGFDETYIVGYGDIDLCFRVLDAGYRIVYTPFARILHHEGGTRGLNLPPSDVLRATTLMQTRVEKGDPFFNPNLSYLHRSPTVVRPREEQRGHRLVRILREFKLIEIPMDSDLWEESLLVLPMKTTPPLDQIVSLSPKNILVVTHELSLSGAPIILAMTACKLKSLGYDIRVVSPVNGPLQEQYAANGIKVVVEPRLLDDARAILFHIDDRDTLLVNTILAWRVVHAARAFNRRILWWIHESDFGQKLAEKESAVAKAFVAADMVMFPSYVNANQYRKFTNRDNYRVAHSGLEIQVPEGYSKQPPLKKNPGDLIFINVATFEPRKGQDILLKAISQLPEVITERVHFYLIGRRYIDRKFFNKLARDARHLKIVTIVGELTNPEVWDYLKAADVFILSSRDEALPISMIEAMAIGKAIISSAAGGIPEVLIDGENGYVVSIEDPDALAYRITYLVENQDEIRRVGELAQHTYEDKLTIEAFTRQVKEFLDELPRPQNPKP